MFQCQHPVDASPYITLQGDPWWWHTTCPKLSVIFVFVVIGMTWTPFTCRMLYLVFKIPWGKRWNQQTFSNSGHDQAMPGRGGSSFHNPSEVAPFQPGHATISR